jgi:two-component system, LytTR family, sensor kinase
MADAVLLVLVAAALAGATGFAGYALAHRVARGGRELGTEAEQARYTTLHLATRAAEHLRGGIEAAGSARAVRDLRALLDCEALALAGPGGVLALDGHGDEVRAAAERIAEQVRSSGRVQVERQAVRAGRETLDAVAAAIFVGDEAVGAVVAFSRSARPGLVRATGEVARWVATQLELAELDTSRAALAEAEVRALRAQISPHFIYNALNAIASFINTDPATARELVLEFADFTRYSFRRHGDFTTVAEELRSVDGYLRLERARFGERLGVTLQIAPEVLSTIIPFLSVQPLVENAVRHGLEAKEGRGALAITATDSGSFAIITVEDDGVGIDPELARAVLAGQGAGEHVGLHNVDARLRQVYGEGFGLVVETNVGSGTLVTMRVPKSQPGRAAERLSA